MDGKTARQGNHRPVFMVDRGVYGVGILKTVGYKIRLSKKVKNGKINMELFVSGFAKQKNKKAPPGFVKMTI